MDHESELAKAVTDLAKIVSGLIGEVQTIADKVKEMQNVIQSRI